MRQCHIKLCLLAVAAYILVVPSKVFSQGQNNLNLNKGFSCVQGPDGRGLLIGADGETLSFSKSVQALKQKRSRLVFKIQKLSDILNSQAEAAESVVSSERHKLSRLLVQNDTAEASIKELRTCKKNPPDNLPANKTPQPANTIKPEPTKIVNPEPTKLINPEHTPTLEITPTPVATPEIPSVLTLMELRLLHKLQNCQSRS